MCGNLFAWSEVQTPFPVYGIFQYGSECSHKVVIKTSMLNQTILMVVLGRLERKWLA